LKNFYLYKVKFVSQNDEIEYFQALREPKTINNEFVGQEPELEKHKNGMFVWTYWGNIKGVSDAEIYGQFDQIVAEHKLSLAYERDDALYLIQSVEQKRTELLNDVIFHQTKLSSTEPQPLKHVKIKDIEESEPLPEDSTVPQLTLDDLYNIVQSEKFLATVNNFYQHFLTPPMGICRCHNDSLRAAVFHRAFVYAWVTHIHHESAYQLRVILGNMKPQAYMFADFVFLGVDKEMSKAEIEQILDGEREDPYGVYWTYEGLAQLKSLFLACESKFLKIFYCD
jgi:hypothetical protein